MLARAAIYLDSNAGAPLNPRVFDALLPLLRESNAGAGAPTHASSPAVQSAPCAETCAPSLVGNPSSIHSHGRQARRLLNEAREHVARSLGSTVQPEALIFTSSGTESNQLAIHAAFDPFLLNGKKPHWILTRAEHEANLQLVDWLIARGGSVSFLALDESGAPDISQLADLWRPETALLSVIWVNNETGVISPIEAAAEAAAVRGVPLHLDGAQAWGKLPLDLPHTGATWVSFSGHKIGGLAGSGLLWCAPKSQPTGLILGKQEIGRRGGTENLLGAIAMGAAASTLNPRAWSEIVGPLREKLERTIVSQLSGVRIHGGDAPRVANTLNLGFEGIEKDGLVMALDLAGFSVSSGSACTSGITAPSHVLLAMGLSEAQARSAVRVSLSEYNHWDELEGFVQALIIAVARLRGRKERLSHA